MQRLSFAHKSSRPPRNLKIGEPFLRLRGEYPPSRCAAPTDNHDDCKNKKSLHRSGVSGHNCQKCFRNTLVTEFLKGTHAISCVLRRMSWQHMLTYKNRFYKGQGSIVERGPFLVKFENLSLTTYCRLVVRLGLNGT